MADIPHCPEVAKSSIANHRSDASMRICNELAIFLSECPCSPFFCFFEVLSREPSVFFFVLLLVCII
ncbi:hypothetical protein Pgin01_01663 [Porphyromonas gingivalis]